MKRKVLSSILSLMLIAGLFLAAPSSNASAALADEEVLLVGGDGFLDNAPPYSDGMLTYFGGDISRVNGNLIYNASGSYGGINCTAINKISTSVAQIGTGANDISNAVKYLAMTMWMDAGSNVSDALMTIGVSSAGASVAAYLKNWNVADSTTGVVTKGIRLTTEPKTFYIPLAQASGDTAIAGFKAAETLAFNSDPALGISGKINISRIALTDSIPTQTGTPPVQNTTGGAVVGDTTAPPTQGATAPPANTVTLPLGDMNGDNKVGADDALEVLKKSVGRITQYSVEKKGEVTYYYTPN